MKIANPSDIGLRRATGEDESFILELERSVMRKLAEAVFGHWVPRPGMGEAFPDDSWIIQYGSDDVGCFTLSQRENLVEIDQLYLVPDARHRGIGRYILIRILTLAFLAHRSVQIALLPGNDVQPFFERAGFRVTAVAPIRISLECSCSEDTQAWTK